LVLIFSSFLLLWQSLFFLAFFCYFPFNKSIPS
jgi:hypothetical protein